MKYSNLTAKVNNLFSVCALFMLVIVSQSVYAAVQMGGHMDFILDSGMTVRVFPEAEKSGPIKPANLLPKKQKVNTKPAGGDPCLKLEKEYEQRVAKQQAKRATVKKNVQPNWVRRTSKLQSMRFRPYWLKRAQPKRFQYIVSQPSVAKTKKSAKSKVLLPEATFVKFITDEAEGKNAAEGGIFHVMVTYGLTKKEEKELEAALQEAVPGAILTGMVDLQPSKQTDNFIVTSGTLSDEGFAPNGVLTSGRAPSFQGSKAAIAGRLSSLGAQLMEATFQHHTSDLSVTFAYDYIVKAPAYNAEIRIDLDKINEAAECTLRTQDSKKKTYRDTKFGWYGIVPVLTTKKKTKTVRVSREQLEEAYKTMVTLGAVEIKIDQNLPDVDVSALESSFMTMAMESFTNMQKSFMTSDELQAQQAAQEGDKKAKDPNADNYEVYTLKRKQERMTGVISMKLSKTVALYRTHSMTGNIGGLLRKHKRFVFKEKLLNDPFFKRGEITVDLDSEALELFEDNMVNNAAIKVIVPFKGNPYTENDVFTRTDVSDGSIIKEFTFATRGKNMEKRNCTFKYIESWSLKGGGKWPLNPEKKCAKEMAVTLVPPITVRRIDVEADLDEMERAGVRGADVLLKHNRYGNEKIETARFRVAKGEPYLEHTLYVDKDDKDVDYKIVLTHKDKGKFATDWQNLEDDFVYANLSGLPKSTLQKIRDVVPEIQEAIPEIKEVLEDVKEVFE